MKLSLQLQQESFLKHIIIVTSYASYVKNKPKQEVRVVGKSFTTGWLKSEFCVLPDGSGLFSNYSNPGVFFSTLNAQ